MSDERIYLEIAPLTYTGAAERFTYHHDALLAIGQLVTVALGPRKSSGVVMAVVAQPEFKTRSITAVIEAPPIPASLLSLAGWMSTYYAASLSSVFSTLLPSGLGKTHRERKPRVIETQGLPTAPLTDEQTAALANIRASTGRTHLVHGVTGAGKTRLYLELAAEALAAGQSVTILVPEITLTPQLVGQFETAFGPLVIATHSKLTEAERHAAYTAASSAVTTGQTRVIVGPRSSLFLPVHQLGLIIVDECHETSYKQEQHPKYHAVTTAAKLSQITGARLILGSATPGLGELFLANEHRINYVRLTKRANAIAHSQATIIDLRNKDLFTVSKFITQPLVAAIEATMTAGRQSLLYLNRRGSASSQVCGNCGHVTICPNCQLPLTFHADLMRLICHHCNFRLAAAAVCTECGAADLKLLGGGTKRIEAEVEKLWPEARVARLDRDSATLPHIKEVYRQLQSGELDILIGTQMIAKGLDLPNIDTVGIISADTMLHLPDFTAAERTFQLITQVSGRAGRGDRVGQVIIQTYSPEHPAIVAASTGDYDTFAVAELAERASLRYPPSTYLLKLELTGSSRDAVSAEADVFATDLRRRGFDVDGPAPAFLETRGGKFVWLMSIKSSERTKLVSVAANLPHDRWSADLDPINLL
ncbi:primosomal protein N' [Candidatus Saccharibacteria bacterium]|nr:primosomal protein N' [Candidatus Saccharibacteria bacterium]